MKSIFKKQFIPAVYISRESTKV